MTWGINILEFNGFLRTFDKPVTVFPAVSLSKSQLFSQENPQVSTILNNINTSNV